MECCTGQLFNTYSSLDGLCHRVIQYLMMNDEDIWKLLKYPTPDALYKENLTMREKADLIYTDSSDSSNFRVFRAPFMDDVFDEQCAQLRVYVEAITPDTTLYGTVDIQIEIVSHVKIINLVEYRNRLEVLLQRVIKTLNGAYVGGVGQLMFDRTMSYYDLVKYNLYNNRNFCGYSLIMSTKVGSTSGSGNCD